MKAVKRAFCLVLALIFSLCVCTGAFAAEARASLYLRSYGAYCYPEEDGSVSVWFEVEGTGYEEVLGVLTIYGIENCLGLLGVNSYMYTATLSIIILIAIIFENVKNRILQ